jgi:hypothetical protein
LGPSHQIGVAHHGKPVAMPTGTGMLLNPVYPGTVSAENRRFDPAVGWPQRCKSVLALRSYAFFQERTAERESSRLALTSFPAHI